MSINTLLSEVIWGPARGDSIDQIGFHIWYCQDRPRAGSHDPGHMAGRLFRQPGPEWFPQLFTGGFQLQIGFISTQDIIPPPK